ncbi:MAG: S8 family serine peptidase [Gammaproteobacteria bacterium]
MSQSINKNLTLPILALFAFTYSVYAGAIELDPQIEQRVEAVQQKRALPGQENMALTLLLSSSSTERDQQEIIELVLELGGRAEILPELDIAMVEVPATQAVFEELISHPLIENVDYIGLSTESFEELEVSRASILLIDDGGQALPNSWYAEDYTGTNAVAGILDSGVAEDHPAFASKEKLIRKEEGSAYDDYVFGVRTPHATGIAGIMLGRNDPYNGVAYGARRMLAAIAGDSSTTEYERIELTLQSLHWMLITGEAENMMPTVINYSFGNGDIACDVCSDWGLMARVVDYVVNTRGVLWTKSAGNGDWIEPAVEGAERYQTTMTTPAENYNALTVANMNTTIEKTPPDVLIKTSDRSEHRIMPSSSRGPTLAGRRKPDLAAPGNDTRTAAPDKEIYAVEENPTFIPYSEAMMYKSESLTRVVGGTSMAAPHVAGAVMILQDAGITQPMSQKALLINSADAMTDADSPDVENHSYVSGSYWNRTYAWGYLNMEEAYEQKDNIYEDKLALNDRVRVYRTEFSAEDKATLVWERRVGSDSAGVPWPLTPINLTLYNESCDVLAKDPSMIDNVKQVSRTMDMQAPEDENVSTVVYIEVALDADVTMIGGANEEAYSLVTSQPVEQVNLACAK